MSLEFVTAITTGLGAMFGWGLADFFAKKTIDKVGSVVSLVWAHVFGVIVLALAVCFQVFILHTSFSLPNGLEDWDLLLFFGALQAVVYLLVYQGFGKGKLSVLNPVFASYSGLAALLSIVLLGESITSYVVLTLSVIFLGIIFLSIEKDSTKSKKFRFINTPGLKEVALASVLAAFWTISWDHFIGGKDWLVYALFMYAIMALTAFIVAKVQQINLSISLKSDVWKFLFLIGACEVVAYAAISLGFSTTSFTSIIALLSGAFSLPTLLFARLFLKERLNEFQIAGTIIVILGIIFLSLR